MLAKWKLYLVKAGVTLSAGWLHLVVGLGLNFQERFNHVPDFSMFLCGVCLPQCISSSLFPMQPEFPLSVATGYPEQRQKQPIVFRKKKEICISQNYQHFHHFLLSKASHEASAVQEDREQTPPLQGRAPSMCRKRRNHQGVIFDNQLYPLCI